MHAFSRIAGEGIEPHPDTRGRRRTSKSWRAREDSCYRPPGTEDVMGSEGQPARVAVEWVPGDGRPEDLDKWQRVVDTAYAGGYGRVRLVRQSDEKWKVTSATTMMPRPLVEGETLPMSKAMREAVRAALRARGFPIM
jgi:hypothetical protein